MPATPEARRPSTRARPTVLLGLAAVLLLARVGTGVWEHLHPPQLQELVTWSAPATPAPGPGGEVQGKPVLYEFTAEWCAPCKKMKREVFGDRDAAEFINRSFHPVRILDTDESAGAQAVRQQQRVTGFPTLLVMLPAGAPRASEGYSNKQETLQFLRTALGEWQRARTEHPSGPGSPAH